MLNDSDFGLMHFSEQKLICSVFAIGIHVLLTVEHDGVKINNQKPLVTILYHFKILSKFCFCRKLFLLPISLETASN